MQYLLKHLLTSLEVLEPIVFYFFRLHQLKCVISLVQDLTLAT